MINSQEVSYKITTQDTKGIQGGPERTIIVEGPTTASQTSELARRLTPLILIFLSPMEGLLSNIGGIPSSDDQILLSLSDSEKFNTNILARFDLINSREIRYIQHPTHSTVLTPLPEITEIQAGLSWYRPSRFALFNVGTPTLYEYFELRCHTKLWLRMGTSRPKVEAAIPGPPFFSNSLVEILSATHQVKF